MQRQQFDQNTEHFEGQQSALQCIDKRSRSETPNKMSATEVLFRAHQKLQMRRKESPHKLLEKQKQRQKKAEELRAQIEESKKKWYEKIRLRQQIAKERWKELLAERKARLYDKLEQAEERRETEIQSTINKAKQEIQKIDETNFIVKMTMSNMKLDLNMKMNETQERRNLIIEEQKKRQHDRHLKEEAAEKRRQELLKETENKFLTNQQKREQADQRRIKMLEEKKRAAQEISKRNLVLQRKNYLGDKISDVMSFVSNSENIWEFLGSERDWQQLGISNQEELLFELISKDQFEIEKLKLKRDAELLNKLIVIDPETGQVYSQKEYLPQAKRNKHHDESTSSNEDDEEMKCIEENEIFNSPGRSYHHKPSQVMMAAIEQQSNLTLTPQRNERRRIANSSLVVSTEEIKDSEVIGDMSDCCSDKDSIAEETPRDIQKRQSSAQLTQQTQPPLEDETFSSQKNFDSYIEQQPWLLTDEVQNYLLYSNRIKMSMKRNILKKTLSEDLTWADFLKNESYQVTAGATGNFPPLFKNSSFTTRSMHSTPERKQEIPCESGKEVSQFDKQNILSSRKSNSSSIISNSNSKKSKKSVRESQNHTSSNSCIQQSAQHNSSSSNLSEKSRISSVVYPSQTKKNPKNQVPGQQSHQQQESRISGSFHSNCKQKNSIAGGGSNQSSTQSLQIQNTINVETPVGGQRKSLNLEQDSARKRNNARMHSSSVQESSGGIPNLSQVACETGEDKSVVFETQSSACMSHTGQQMSQLITNSKPFMPLTKMVVRKLTANAVKMLFPITQQKLLFKRPGKEGQFGKCKINVKIEDIILLQNARNQPPASVIVPTPLQNQVSFTINDPQIQSDLKAVASTSASNSQQQLLQVKGEDSTPPSGETLVAPNLGQKHSLHSTPSFTKRRESTDTNNSNAAAKEQPTSLATPTAAQQQIASDQLLSGPGSVSTGSGVASTPTQQQQQQQSRLWQLHQKFWEKIQDKTSGPSSSSFVDSSSSSKKKLLPSSQLQQQQQQVSANSAAASESSPSPKKDAQGKQQETSVGSIPPPSIISTPSLPQLIQQPQQQAATPQNNQASLNTSAQLEVSATSLQPGTIPLLGSGAGGGDATMNEQGYKELIIKYLMTDNIQQLKTDDNQKTIFLEGDEANKLIDYLEQYEIQFRYCRLCDLIIPEHCTTEAHVQTKSHRRTREDLFIKDIEDLQFSILSLSSAPGDIEKELVREKEKALKRKVKRLKTQMNALAVSHENATYCPGKELTSANKKRFQILCVDLEKQVVPIIKDYEALESTLKEIIKILDMRVQSDLHVMRKLRYIPILIEICKRILVCHKSEFKHLGRILEYVIKIISVFCSQRENRNYMLQTNRLAALIELLNWCLNRPTQLFYGITFMPQLFHILIAHVKHRAPYECQQMKELYIEYLISSQIPMKIKGKFQIINGPLDLSEMMGQVPIFLLKSASFLESLTSLISIDARSRPVYEKSSKIAEHVLFVVQNTELFGIIPMISTILLSRTQPFKPSSTTTSQQPSGILSNGTTSSSSTAGSINLLPQTIVSLAITSIKIINNVFRMDYRFAQHMMSDFEIQEQLYHMFNYILLYGVETADKQEDSKELLHETILMMGYFSLNNDKNQALLCKGENTLLQKLCNMPFTYFCDKKLKEILFPTLIMASYKNDHCLAIMDQEISIELLVDFIQLNLKEELPRIIEEECDYQSMSSVGHSAVERNRSPSHSSTNSSQCSLQIDMANGNSPYLPLYMRFPKKVWKDSITFYSKVLY